MLTFSKFKGALAGLSLAFCAAALAPAHAVSYQDFKKIATHGYWFSFSVRADAQRASGAMTEFKDGSTAAIMITGGKLSVVLDDPKWHFDPHSDVPVRMTLDGIVFNGSALALAKGEIAVGGSDENFVKRLIDAKQAIFEVNGERWTLNLEGLDESLSEAVDAIKRASLED